MTKLTDEDKKRIVELRNSGVSPKEIIKNYFPNITRQTVSSVCKKFNEIEPVSPTYSERKVETSDEEQYNDDEEEEEDNDDLETVKSFGYLPIYKEKQKEKNIVQEKPINNYQNFQPPVEYKSSEEQVINDNFKNKPVKIEENFTEPMKNEEYKENPNRFQSLQKIDLYIDKFPQKLVCITGENIVIFKEKLKFYSDFELEALLETIRTRISSNGLQSGMHTIFFTGTSLIENVGCNFGLKLKGYSDNLARNQSVKDCIDEISIEMISFNNISPQKRLVFLLMMNMVSTHNLNNTDESMREVLSQKIDSNVINKYQEL